MEEPSNHRENELKYGVIYVRRNPERVPWLERMTDAVEALASPLQIEWIKDDEQDGLLLTARRFNVGNLGRYATVSLHLNAYGEMGTQYLAVRKFFDALMGVMDSTEGDIVLDESDFQGPGYTESVHGSLDCVIRNRYPESVSCDCAVAEPAAEVRASKCIRLDEEEPARLSLRAQKRRRHGIFKKKDKEAKLTLDKAQTRVVQEDEQYDRFEYMQCDVEGLSVPDEAELLDRDETQEVAALERSQERELEEIKKLIVNYIAKHQADPEEMIRTLLRGKVIVGQPGHLLVNGDMKIVLPEYDEMEIKMPAMCRVLYILCMKLRSEGKSGIVLKNIDEYRNDLANIYGLVKPGAREDLVQKYVDRLCDPWTESLNQTISKVNRCIKNHITSKDMQQRYCITGQPGKEYGIAIDPKLLTLPAAVTM